MVSYVFDRLLATGIRQGQIPARTAAARDWFRTTAQKTRTTPEAVMKKSSKLVGAGGLEIGQMYMFQYDPKHKKMLPYYDRFPVVFPFAIEGRSFYGINMHYLPFKLRAVLMDSLYELAVNKKYDHTTRLRLSYERLKSASRFRYFRPTVHKYLDNHVRSRFLSIESVEWDIALMLPVHRFEKASARKVWADSQRKIRDAV